MHACEKGRRRREGIDEEEGEEGRIALVVNYHVRTMRKTVVTTVPTVSGGVLLHACGAQPHHMSILYAYKAWV